MASKNGVLNPPSPGNSFNSPSNFVPKRKRDNSAEISNHINGVSDSDGANIVDGIIYDSQAVAKDLLDLLKPYDTSLSILSRTLPLRSPSLEHQAKRQKSNGKDEGLSTILARASSNTYKNVEEVLEDIDLAVADVLTKFEISNVTSSTQYAPMSPEESNMARKANAFKKRAHEIVRKDKAGQQKQMGDSQHLKLTPKYGGNGVLATHSVTQVNVNSSENKSVLTLYANAPGPKQLFSSLHQPPIVAGELCDVSQPLQELALPNGIYTTQVVPVQYAGINGDKNSAASLGEVFKTPDAVPSIQPPKPSKVSTTRSLTVGWYQPATADPAPKHGTYSRQPISTGQWLDYGSTAVNHGAKRRQRGRTLSLSSVRPLSTDAEGAEAEAAKLDALFRSSYSGFAPTKDNTAAVAPDGVINKVWWQRVGEGSFERLLQQFVGADSIGAPKELTEDLGVENVNDETEGFRKAVDAYDSSAIDPNLELADAITQKSIQEKDVDEVLDGVSDLIATLNSFQRNRHVTLNPPSRGVALLSASESSSLGTPSKPSDQEQSTYEILKSQLTLLIASLPPYAVAKLNSDKLGELGISTKLEIEDEDYKGVMEEDDAAARTKALALGGAPSRSSQSTSVHRSSSSSLYGNQYTPARSVASISQQYHGSSHTPIRPPPNSISRQPSTVSYPPQRSTTATAYRPNAYATPTYAHQSARPASQNYTAGNSAQYSAPPAATQRLQNQSHHNPSQPSPQPYATSRYPYTTQSTGNSNGSDARYANAANVGRQASPQKPLYNTQISSASRPPFSTPTSTLPQSRSYTQIATTNGGGAQLPQSQVQPASTNFSSFMTQEQQDSMMERQRKQLAQQQSAQQLARNAAQTGAMGSPSKGRVNGPSAVPTIL